MSLWRQSLSLSTSIALDSISMLMTAVSHLLHYVLGQLVIKSSALRIIGTLDIILVCVRLHDVCQLPLPFGAV